MQALPQLIGLQSLESIIDCSPLMVVPETPLSDAIALMAAQGKNVLVGSASQILGYFTERHLVQLLASGIDLRTAKISEVMHTSVMMLKISEFSDLTSVLLLLHQQLILPVVDDQGQIVGTITSESICQVLAQETQKTRGDFEESQERLRLLAFEILQESATRLILALEATQTIYWERNLNNDRMLFLSMVSETGETQEISYSEVLALVHTDDQEKFAHAHKLAIASLSSFEVEHRILVKGRSEYKWLLTRGMVLTDPTGIARMIGVSVDITYRVQAEAALHESEKRFRAIFNGTFQFTGLLTPAGIVLEANQALLDFGGLQPEDIVGRPYWETRWWTISHETQNQLKVAIALAARGEFVRYEVDVLGINQTVRTIDFSLKPLIEETGKVALLIAEARDITELKQTQAALQQVNQELEMRVAERTIVLKQTNRQLLSEIVERQIVEEQLRQSQQMLQLIMDTIPQCIFWKDRNSVYLGCNRNFAIAGGLNSPEEIVGKTDYDLPWKKEEADFYRECDIRVMQSNTPEYHIIEPLLRADGKQTWLNTNKVPLHNLEGNVVGILGTFEDITDRQQAETALRETQQQLQAILDNSSAVMYLVDSQDRFLLINHQFEKLLNITQNQIAGKSIYDIFAYEIADGFAANNHQVIVSGIPIEAEEVVPLNDGLHTYLSVKFPLKDANGISYAVGGISTDITYRKLVEESLLRFRKAIESTSDAIGMADITGEGIYVNAAFIKLFEYTLEELQAAGGVKVIFKQKIECKKVLAKIQRGESWRGEVMMQTRCGRSLQIYLCTDAIKDHSGKIVGTVNIYTDITQRKQAEEGLRLRDRAIAASSNGIIIADVTMPARPIIYVNPAFERMSGYSAAEVIGQNFLLLQGTDINQPGLQELNAAMREGKDFTVILRNYRKDGSLFWNELNISPVYDIDGYLTHYIGIQNDITERKQAETALLVSQQRLQYLLSSSPAVIYTCRSYGDFGGTFVSENVTTMMGYEAREMVENPSFWGSHLHPEDATQAFAKLSNVLEQGQYTLEYRFLHQDGTYRWVHDQGKVVRDQAGKSVEMVGYWADITPRKQLEHELRVALEKEKELSELKSRFVSMTSHEFRTPLSTILSSCELLEHYRQKWTQEKQLTHLHRIQSAVKRMTEMLNDVLVIGKAEAGKLEFRPTSLDLVEYCRQLVEEVQLNLSNQHIISFTSQYESVPCYMDEKLLGHILSNLLSNAIKYSPIGSTVKFTLTCEDLRAVFAIQDQGIGIPEEDLPRLFESFHRARNVGNILGTGLGLAIVKKCVDIHQGEITVTSKLGFTTKFIVTLPLKNQSKTEVICLRF
ncbi:PAS domain S-box protein [Komarekiella sp. 'clone 1']|uniref:histidine kinase n=1 Tax=Komarekiella delphini-convector SJRDD-AB1 TaxID=2593771 RepID=A0AA40SYI7_9NOST|nr:PAS domain S-box protein [Komarekiella delphini-convector]MBD6617435.1 PAS domain S-box protein [Komarekiella delphini-convector SJRDD-AB1]